MGESHQSSCRSLAIGFFAVISLVGVAGAVAWQVLREREPVYQGKRLTGWLEQYGTNHWPAGGNAQLEEQAQTAIRQIGTNAIPTYLKMMSATDSPLKLKLMLHVPAPFWDGFHFRIAFDYHFLGAYGLVALGSDARPAVPGLIALLSDKAFNVRYPASFTLRYLGPVANDALPDLIQCLDDSDFMIQDDAVIELGTIHQEPERVIPILIRFIERYSGNAILCCDAMESLSKFGEQAKPAVPTLVGLLDYHKDENRSGRLDEAEEGIRSTATNALKQIDHEAAAKAGVK